MTTPINNKFINLLSSKILIVKHDRIFPRNPYKKINLRPKKYKSPFRDKPEEAARPCTRVEITLQNRQPFSGIEFGVAGISESSDLPELSETLRIYLDMLEHILLLGGDVDGHLRKINYRSRIKLEPHLYGAVVKNLRIKAVEVQDRISPRKVEIQS